MTEEQTLSAYRAMLECLPPDGDIARQVREKMRQLQWQMQALGAQTKAILIDGEARGRRW